uniref:Uncharacterized protein n=1 Tax=Timema monikensis TaxID=170555 RepID=A0A7R9E273_9NEOP|nr:unnamed protein product [Timema monikensis]
MSSNVPSIELPDESTSITPTTCSGVTKMSRPTLAEQEDLIKESLFKFVRKHIPSAQLRDMAPFEHQDRATIQDWLRERESERDGKSWKLALENLEK